MINYYSPSTTIPGSTTVVNGLDLMRHGGGTAEEFASIPTSLPSDLRPSHTEDYGPQERILPDG